MVHEKLRKKRKKQTIDRGGRESRAESSKERWDGRQWTPGKKEGRKDGEMTKEIKSYTGSIGDKGKEKKRYKA